MSNNNRPTNQLHKSPSIPRTNSQSLSQSNLKPKRPTKMNSLQASNPAGTGEPADDNEDTESRQKPSQKHPAVAQFLELKDEIKTKDKTILELTERVKTLEEGLKKYQDLPPADEINTIIEELKKKVSVQENAIAEWIEALDVRMKQVEQLTNQVADMQGE